MFVELQTEVMTDDSKRLAIEGPKTLALRATFINGSVVVESEEDRERKKREAHFPDTCNGAHLVMLIASSEGGQAASG